MVYNDFPNKLQEKNKLMKYIWPLGKILMLLEEWRTDHSWA